MEDDKKYKPLRKKYKSSSLHSYSSKYFRTENPVVSIYHNKGLNKKIASLVGDRKNEVAHWPPAPVLAKLLRGRNKRDKNK